jgi:hypothetical protein
MKMHISAKKSVAKKYLFVLLFVMPFFLSACGGPKHMVTMDTKPALTAKTGKALLVIARTTSMAFGVTIENYLDKQFIGQTKGKSYFITDVAPGQHYVMGHAENWSSARINFEAGRTYFLNQDIRMGVWMARTGFTPLTANDAVSQINESGMEYRVYDTKNPGDDMSDKDFNEVKADFDKEAAQGEHKDIVEYKGDGKP